MASFSSWRSYWNFAKSVSTELRYVRPPEVDSFLETVLSTSSERHVEINKNNIFWRAQLGHDWRTEAQDEVEFEVECAYSPNRMKPLPNRATDGRANSKGIPCLYLATQKDTAICEVRPSIGSYVSIAQFKISRKLKIIDCGRAGNGTPLFLEEPDPTKREAAVWSHIDTAFSAPMTRGDDSADYAPTQIIAEMFKKEGFDGIAYKSNFGEAGYNVALFDLEAASLINCGLFRVDRIHIESSQQDNPYFVRSNNDTA